MTGLLWPGGESYGPVGPFVTWRGVAWRGVAWQGLGLGATLCYVVWRCVAHVAGQGLLWLCLTRCDMAAGPIATGRGMEGPVIAQPWLVVTQWETMLW